MDIVPKPHRRFGLPTGRGAQATADPQEPEIELVADPEPEPQPEPEPEPPPTRSGARASRRTGRAGRNLTAAILVGALLGGLVLASLFVRKEAFVGVVTLAIVIAVWEMTEALAVRAISVPLVPVAVGAVGMQVAAYAAGGQALAVCYALTCLGVLVWRVAEGAEGAVRDVAGGLLVAAYPALLAGFAMLLLSTKDGSWRVLTFILVTIASDIGGYAAGVLFGRHPMAPAVSPKKSWEGFAGSTLACVLVGVATVTLAPRRPLVGRCRGRSGCGRRRDGRGPGGVADQARPRHQGHGLAAPRPRRHPRPDRLAAVRGSGDLGAAAPDGDGALMAATDLPTPSPRPGELTFTAPRRGKPPVHLADLTLAERRAAVEALGHKAFRAGQLSQHYFVHHTVDPDEMTDLPAEGRPELVGALLPTLLTPLRVREADHGATVKTLWRLFDGALVETVLMRYPDRVTVCVSSQAGCGMNCPFCATGQAGLTRNMSAAEIVEQVVAAARSGPAAGDATRVTNVVFMGMGEALANYRAAVGAIRRLVSPAPEGLGLSARGITMSTVGLVPAIDRLAGEGLPVTLALSLHAPDDGLRDELVPVNTRWKVAEALDAARRYFETTGRRVSIEYALIRDVNDQAWRADLLGAELNRRGRGWVHVNPIPLNPTPGSKWTASDPRVEHEFVRRLRAAGIPTTVRDTRGREIDGACGQLAAAAV